MPKDKNISDRFSEISLLISDAVNWTKIDPRLDAHLAAYVCVLLSGAIEDAIERMISLKAGVSGDHEMASYVVKVVGVRFRNPDWPAITGLLGEFSDGYKLAWTNQYPSNGRVFGSLESINNVKNSLAHKGYNSLYITLLDVQSYFNDVLPAVDHLEQILVPSP